MKPTAIPTLTLTILFMALGLSACNMGAGDATPTDSLAAIYTSAAITLTAQAGQPTTTPTPVDASLFTQTPQVTPSDTPLSLPSVQPASATPFPVNSCDNSAYISDVTIPDHTVMTPGQAFVKTWALQNTGTCAWTATYSMTFVSGTAMSGASTVIGKSVAPGQQANISVSLVAPATAGEYTGYWRLANDSASKFGQSVYVIIDVSTGGTGTVTVTATPGAAGTSTGTPTLGPTSASTSTATNLPANTHTPTPTTLPPSTETPTPTSTVPAPTVTPTP